MKVVFIHDHSGPCAICRKDTHYINVDFETWLCPDECTDRLWRMYDRAGTDGTE